MMVFSIITYLTGVSQTDSITSNYWIVSKVLSYKVTRYEHNYINLAASQILENPEFLVQKKVIDPAMNDQINLLVRETVADGIYFRSKRKIFFPAQFWDAAFVDSLNKISPFPLLIDKNSYPLYHLQFFGKNNKLKNDYIIFSGVGPLFCLVVINKRTCIVSSRALFELEKLLVPIYFDDRFFFEGFGFK